MKKALLSLVGVVAVLGIFIWVYYWPVTEMDLTNATKFPLEQIIASGIYDGKVIFSASDTMPWPPGENPPPDWRTTSDFYFSPGRQDQNLAQTYTGDGYTFLYPINSQITDPGQLGLIKILVPTDKPDKKAVIQITKEHTNQTNFADFSIELQKNFLTYLTTNPVDSRYFFFDYQVFLLPGQPVLLHQRNFYSFTGELYNMVVWLGGGDYLLFSGEGDYETLGAIYSTVKIN